MRLRSTKYTCICIPFHLIFDISRGIGHRLGNAELCFGLQRQRADTKLLPCRTCARLSFWQLGLRSCLLPKLRKHTTPLSHQSCNCYVGQGHALRQWVAISGARHGGRLATGWDPFRHCVGRRTLDPSACSCAERAMLFLYLQMFKAHAIELKQAKFGKANGLDESTKQVSIGYTLRRYWCPRRKAHAKEYKQLCGCTSRQPASLFFLFPYPYWDLLRLLPWILMSASYMAAATGASYTREENGFFSVSYFAASPLFAQAEPKCRIEWSRETLAPKAMAVCLSFFLRCEQPMGAETSDIQGNGCMSCSSVKAHLDSFNLWNTP